MCNYSTGWQQECRTIREVKRTYHYSEEVVLEAIFVNMVSPRLAVLVKCGLK
jgi:hypothetical protein